MFHSTSAKYMLIFLYLPVNLLKALPHHPEFLQQTYLYAVHAWLCNLVSFLQTSPCISGSGPDFSANGNDFILQWFYSYRLPRGDPLLARGI